MTTTYTTWNEFFEREVVAALDDHAADFDLDELAEALKQSRMVTYERGFRWADDHEADHLWELVAQYARS